MKLISSRAQYKVRLPQEIWSHCDSEGARRCLGQRVFFMTLLSATCLLAGIALPQQSLPDAPSATMAAKSQGATRPADSGWPRTFTSGSDRFTIYQPQVDKWEGNLIDLYSAVELKTEKGTTKYGVIWLQARTEVDKVNRLVTLDQVRLTKVKFPAAAGSERDLEALLQKKLPGVAKTVSLDRLEAEIDINQDAIKAVEVKNEAPKVIITSKPSVLVLIDGEPQIREIPGTNLLRVINTRSTIVVDNSKHYYLRVGDAWLEPTELDGPWKNAEILPDGMSKAEEFLVREKLMPQTEKAEAKQPSLQKAAAPDVGPVVYVAFHPAELIEMQGTPQYKPIGSSGLDYISNTNGNVFRFKGQHYVLISGRWFTSDSLDGPWTFVAGTDLPAEFSRIPIDHPKATILGSVAGTPESQEALIANSIPQTATITRSEAKLTVRYDGEPHFGPVEGIALQYATNTSAAVIKAPDGKYYSVEAGVWFKAASPLGPWTIADSVPAEIYDIPPSSPLHYVTYVKVFGSTPQVVYVGYTPGYYGTVVSSSTMTVVYGTGWYYPPYIGPTVWYGWPYTYGVGAGFTYTTESGWSFGFGYGYTYYPWYYPWWGPMGYYGCCWYPYYGWGAWGGAAAANVYGVWGNTAYSRTGAAWANPYTGNYGAATRGVYQNAQTGRSTVAGRGYNTNVYTGATGGYRGAATYNPNTGIVAGAGSAYAGNIYSGQGAAGRGGFVYNTNTNAGIAAGKNNVYAGKDGSVYRYNRNTGNWSSNTGSGWQPVNKPQPQLQNQLQMRNQGAQRSSNFNSMRSFGGARMGGGRRR